MNNKTLKNADGSQGSMKFTVKRIIIYSAVMASVLLAFLLGRFIDGKSIDNVKPTEEGENFEYNVTDIQDLNKNNDNISNNIEKIKNDNTNPKPTSPNASYKETLQLNSASNSNKQDVSSSVASSSVGKKYPSVEYLNFLHTITMDYNEAKVVWGYVRKQGYRTKRSDDTVNQYMNNIDKNIKSLVNDWNNYEALSGKYRSQINSYSRLANEIEKFYYSYPLNSE